MKKITLGLGVLALALGIGGFYASTAAADRGNPSFKTPYYSAERHAAMEQALNNKDYETWKKLMAEKGPAAEKITAENFAKFAEAHILAKQGNFAEAQKIREELGLNQGRKAGFRCGENKNPDKPRVFNKIPNR